MVDDDPRIDPETGEPYSVNYCNINWFRDNDTECLQGLARALQEEKPYEAQFLSEQAPWYSRFSGYNYPRDPSHKFFGIYGLSAEALADSSRDVKMTEGILSGGVLGRERLSIPRFRFRVMLTAADEEGLMYGVSWLSKALSEQACGTHGPSCGSSDLTFFARCPAFVRNTNAPIAAYEEKIDLITRVYHDVKCIAGPVVSDTFHRDGENAWGAIVEFDLAAGVPTMFGLLNPFIGISQDGETIIQDIPINEIPYPSAELAGADVTVATNYSLNPSVETNATGWTTFVSGGILSGTVASGRVTGELSAAGTSSFRAVFTASGAGGPGAYGIRQEVDISARPAGASVSFTIWAAQVLMAGSPVRVPMNVQYQWLDGGGGAIGTAQDAGAIPLAGGSVNIKSLAPPVGAARIVITVTSELTSWNAGTILRMYADALAVTVP